MTTLKEQLEREEEIKALGLTAPRVTFNQIQEIIKKIRYEVYVVPETTTTQATAILFDFVIAVGSSACVDPRNFNQEFGKNQAIKNAEAEAIKKLWEFEGYRMKFNSEPVAVMSIGSFGWALSKMKQGGKLRRKGWNGSGMFAYYVDGGSYPAQSQAIKGFFPQDKVVYRPYLALKTAQGDVAAWTPSTSDLLGDDWIESL